MEALNESRIALDALQMIDSTVARAPHQTAGTKGALRDRVPALSRGGFTSRIHLCVDMAALPVRTEITLGQTSDYPGFDLAIVDNLPKPSALPADRGQDADNVRKVLEACELLPVIPCEKSASYRAALDHRLYPLRNLVERCFNKLKNARRAATRCDKSVESFPGFIDITSIRLWLPHLST